MTLPRAPEQDVHLRTYRKTNRLLSPLPPCPLPLPRPRLTSFPQGLGKTLSAIAFLHTLMAQGTSPTPAPPASGAGAGGSSDSLLPGQPGSPAAVGGAAAPAPAPVAAPPVRALLVVPANVVYNMLAEFKKWLPATGSPQESLSPLSFDKVRASPRRVVGPFPAPLLALATLAAAPITLAASAPRPQSGARV